MWWWSLVLLVFQHDFLVPCTVDSLCATIIRMFWSRVCSCSWYPSGECCSHHSASSHIQSYTVCCPLLQCNIAAIISISACFQHIIILSIFSIYRPLFWDDQDLVSVTHSHTYIYITHIADHSVNIYIQTWICWPKQDEAETSSMCRFWLRNIEHGKLYCFYCTIVLPIDNPPDLCSAVLFILCCSVYCVVLAGRLEIRQVLLLVSKIRFWLRLVTLEPGHNNPSHHGIIMNIQYRPANIGTHLV